MKVLKEAKVKTLTGDLYLTLRELAHPKKVDEIEQYLSFSNGTDVSGVFLDENTVKELIKFLSELGKKKAGRPAKNQ